MSQKLTARTLQSARSNIIITMRFWFTWLRKSFPQTTTRSWKFPWTHQAPFPITCSKEPKSNSDSYRFQIQAIQSIFIYALLRCSSILHCLRPLFSKRWPETLETQLKAGTYKKWRIHRIIAPQWCKYSNFSIQLRWATPLHPNLSRKSSTNLLV